MAVLAPTPVVGQQPGSPPAPVPPSYQSNGLLNNGNNPVPELQTTAPTAPPPPKTPTPPAAAPAISTAQPAIQDVNQKMATVNNIAATQKTPPPQMATLVNAAGDRKAVAVGSQDAQALFGQGYTLETKAPTGTTPPAQNAAPGATGTSGTTPTTPAGLTPLPNAPAAPETQTAADKATADFKANSDATTAKADQAYATYQSNLDQLRNGTFPLSADQQAQLDNITQGFQALINDQKIANQNYTAAVTEAGISAGRNMYAPEVELGNVNAAISKGVRDIADIQVKMASAITTAKQAFADNNFKLLNASYDALTKSIDDQRKVSEETYTAAKDALAAAQTKFDNDMKTAQFNFQTAQELNKPILEADAKLKDYMYNEMQKYPDAGITVNDTVQGAVDKIKASKSYQDSQAQTAADLAKTKAETAASYASAEASRAAAAKSRADTALKNSGTADAAYAPYYHVTSTGGAYVDASQLQGTAAEKKAIVDAAQADGVRIITNKNDAADLTNITNVYSDLDTIDKTISGIDQPSALARDLGGAGLTFFAKMAETDPQKAAAGALGDASLDILKAISGTQGFRGNASVIAKIEKNLPTIYDTKDTVKEKMGIIRTLVSNREDALLGTKSVTVTDPKTGQSSTGRLSQEEINDAKKQGYDVK